MSRLQASSLASGSLYVVAPSMVPLLEKSSVRSKNQMAIVVVTNHLP